MDLTQKKINIATLILIFPGSVISGGILGGITIDLNKAILIRIFGIRNFEVIRLDLWGVALLSSFLIPTVIPLLYWAFNHKIKNLNKILKYSLSLLVIWGWSLFVTIGVTGLFLIFR